jgi:hypothetical protein
MCFRRRESGGTEESRSHRAAGTHASGRAEGSLTRESFRLSEGEAVWQEPGRFCLSREAGGGWSRMAILRASTLTTEE